MKKISSILVIIFLAYSCTNIENLNTDPNSAYTTSPSTLVSYAQKELSDYVNTPNVNENNFRLTMQYWQETTYTDESNYDFVGRNVSNSVWNDCYVNVLNNLNQAKKIINVYNPTATELATWPVTKVNQLAIIDMQMVYTYQTLVDTFGNIPYSQSLNLESNQLPVYDDAATVYEALITRLKADIALLNTTGTSFDNGDYYYHGDVAKWKKFGNTLLLKLAITISDKNTTLAQSTITTAVNDGVFTSAADNCQFQYLAASPNYSPLYENLKASNRNDYVAGQPIVDYMNTASDTRISKYFDPLNDGTGTFIGATIGEGASFSAISHVGSFAYTATTPGELLTYTETAFYLAEAAARGYIATAPATAYDTAVSASFTEWGLATDAAAYLTAHPYNSSNWKQSIGEQAWVAMYNQPLNSWNFWRRLDYPVLTPSASAVSIAADKIPVRLTYPVKETTTNPTNWTAASTAIGGDKLTTKIFWDKN